MLDYLKNSDGFIKISNDNIEPSTNDWLELNNKVKIKHLAVGVIEVQPTKESNQSIVLSCGIHGNETAPIEIISKLISQIVNAEIEPKVNILFILGNPESMKIPARFVSINLNRLFAGAYKSYEIHQDNRYELRRAERLEELLSDFFEQHPKNIKIHLDLHTAIKPSYHKTFAIRPFCSSRISSNSKQLLLAMGIEAVLQHNKPSTTFSYFSVDKFGAEAYTLELGKVKRFGENNPKDFAKASNCLKLLICNDSIPSYAQVDLVEYKIVAEIIKYSDQFKFHIADTVENFTSFPQGYLVAEDSNFNYRVAYPNESVVFPNINVPIGQRVAVMVTKDDYGSN